MRTLLTGAGVLLFGTVTALSGLAVAATLLPGSASSGPPIAGSAGEVAEIPGGLEQVYADAAGRYCTGLPWEVLAGIGWVESRHGGGDFDPASGQMHRRILGPPLDGRPGWIALPDPSSHDGWAHAEGPMQFLPSTWRRWATLAPGRAPGSSATPHNIWDAIHGAARMLCGGRPHLADLRRAVYGYNRDWDYVEKVLARADRYRILSTPTTLPTLPSDPQVGSSVPSTVGPAVTR